MKRYILLLMAVCCLFSISAQQSTKEIPVEPLCLVAPDSAQKTKQLVILQTSDTHSRIEPIAVTPTCYCLIAETFLKELLTTICFRGKSK